MVLVDTSVWIEVFRKPSRVTLDTVAPLRDISTCLPVIQEVLQGFRDEFTFRRARTLMLDLRLIDSPMALDLFEAAVELYRNARRSGLTIRSSTDCLIAASAIRNDLTVLHMDRDYELLSRVSPLKSREIVLPA